MTPKPKPRQYSFSIWVYSIVSCFVILILLLLWLSFTQSIAERNQRAGLYARMIEGTITRTLESVEVSLASVADDLNTGALDSDHLQRVRARAQKMLRFAPHLRQIVVIQGSETLFDTLYDEPYPINLGVLGIDWQKRQHLSLGLQLGHSIRGRFLPRAGNLPDESQKRSLIPVGFSTQSQDRQPLKVIATLNPDYLKRYINDLDLAQHDNVYLVNFSADTLLQKGLYGPHREGVVAELNQLIERGGDESLQEQNLGFVPLNTVAIRLLAKYPLAVALVVEHRQSFYLWLAEKKILLLGLAGGLLILGCSALLLVRNNRESLEMKEQVQLLSKVVEHNPTIIVITDAQGKIQYVNKSFSRITGYSLEDVQGKNPRMLQSGETSDNEYREMWQQISSGGTWYGEFLNRTREGALYWERATIGSLRNELGEVSHYIALKQVITEEKEAAEKLRLASAVFSAAAEAIMVTDADNRIQMVNDSFRRITGYEEDEVQGCNPSVLKSGKHDDEFYQTLYGALKTHHYWEGEIWNRRKNGQVYPQWLTISSRYDQTGHLEGYVCLFSDITKRKNDEAIIIRQANFDALTGLPNRNLFSDRLSQAIRLSSRDGSQVALMFIDLDRFKYVNDTFGHFSGDLLLKQVSSRLTECVRKSDTVARLGGDEFAVVVPQLNSIEVVDRIADKILASLEKPYNLNGHEAFISCSIGIALFPDNGEEFESLVLHADAAMYKAKARGRNTKEYYSTELNESSLLRSQMEKEIFRALDLNQFFLVYQPIWSTDGARIEALEVLLRWRHPEKGLVSPADFIPIAEETACIHSIGEWVLEQSCRFARDLRQTLGHCPTVCVNVSSLQFQRGGIVTQLADMLQRYDLPGDALLLEITESLLLLDEEVIGKQFQALVDMGIRLAVDDFGTGYSSLSYLKKYPVSRIKIDKSFINDLGQNEDDQALVSGLISMADSLAMEVIVEGVETVEQLNLLQTYGRPKIQGYLFSRPLSEPDFIEALKKSS